uniref:Galactoside transport system permease protein mglC n=1 Tax=Anthurium amnicola TaxID=1678845 RepID=A0A1D1Z4X9_9ARAE
MKNIGAAPIIVFFFLLIFVDSARDVFVPIAHDTGRNHPFMEDDFDTSELVKVFDDEVSSLQASATEFSRSCLEIPRKAKEILDQSLINELDRLASTFCRTADLEAKLRSNETCATCRGILQMISDEFGDTDKQLKIIAHLLKVCEAQTFADQCKQFVFAFGPIAMTTLQKIMNMDLCHKVYICSDPRNQTQYVNQMHMGKFEHIRGAN